MAGGLWSVIHVSSLKRKSFLENIIFLPFLNDILKKKVKKKKSEMYLPKK
jgi:hypothetical protein